MRLMSGVALLAVALAGCAALPGGGPAPLDTFELSAPSVDARSHSRRQILIAPPSALKALDSQNIVIKTSARSIQYLKGAQWGVSYGLEVPLWYAPEGVKDEFSWRRSTDFGHVGKEVATMRNGVGLSEISNFAKYKVTGAGAAAWLDRMLACKLPKRGRMTLAPMLKDDGKLIGDFTLANIDDAEWFIAGSGIAEQYHMRWFEAHLPKDGSVRIEALGQKLTGLAVAGPKA